MTLVLCSQERLFDHVSIALVGKYTDLKDSYMSVIKALEHSAFRCRRKLTLHVCLPFFDEISQIHDSALVVGRIIGSRARSTGRKS
jgi:CTP synthase (UTP-ammonia lyase)